MDYATVEDLKLFGRQPEALSDAGWAKLATAASRFFDTVTEVDPDFYGIEIGSVVRSFYGDGSGLLAIDDLPVDTTPDVAIANNAYPVPVFQVIADSISTYLEAMGGVLWIDGIAVIVSGDWTPTEKPVPADVNYAVIEIALHAWRKGDPSFASISNVENSILLAELPPTARATADKYRAMYTNRCLFA